jgi:VCBS repeat-containing protein
MATPNFDAPIANPFSLRNIKDILPDPRNAYNNNPVFADIDGDGDLDLFVGYTINSIPAGVFFFRNDGTAATPSFAAPVNNPFGLVDVTAPGRFRTYASPTFADIDGDGDLDLFVGDFYDGTTFFQNTGTRTAPSFAAPVRNPFGLRDVGNFNNPTFADIDGDGDFDAFIGESNGNTFFFQNTGTRTAPSFAAPVTNPFGLSDLSPRSDYASPTFADVDGDGDLDAFVGALNGNTFFFQNTGTRTAPSFAAPVTNPFGLSDVGVFSNPTLADIDNDGDLDAFVGELFGDTRFFENNANDARLSVNPGSNATEPSTPGSFTLSLSRPAPASGLTVFYTLSGTATNGTDYTTLPGRITFAAGATTATVTVSPIADNLAEGNETVILTLLDRSGYTLGANTTATITLADLPPNQPPTAVNDTATTDEDTLVTINVLANDTDPDGNPRSLTNFTNPTNGTVTRNDNGTPANLTDDQLIYTPNANYNGSDSFTYTISDGNGGTATATVTLTINSVNDSATISGTATASVTEDGSNPDLTTSGTLTVSDVDTGENIFSTTVTSAAGNLGSLSITEAGAFNYSVANSALQFLGASDTRTDTFTVQSFDGTATQDITITLNGINDTPTVANLIADQTTAEDSPFSFTLPNNIFADVDTSDTLTLTATLADGSPLPTWLTFNGTTFSGTPNDPDVGTISIKVTATDSSFATISDTFDLTVTAVNEPPVANDDQYTTFFKTPITLRVSDLLSNDIDGDGDPLTILNTRNATNGRAVLNTNGTPDNPNDDTIVFTPFKGSSGAARFDYTLSDGNGGTDVATVTILVGLSLIGTSAPETLTGTEGNDQIEGRQGNDTLSGLGGDDSLTGGDGNDFLQGNAGNDTMRGGNNNDTLLGGEGQDWLYGGLTGTDLLIGGLGSDILSGGSSIDIFAYTALAERGELAAGDTINSFSTSRDKLDLTALLPTLTGYSGNPLGYLRFVQSGANALMQIDENGGGDGYVNLATLTNVTATSLVVGTNVLV